MLETALIVVGLDPGSTATGLAAVARRRGRMVLLDHAVVRTSSRDPVPERLRTIHAGIESFIHHVQHRLVGDLFDLIMQCLGQQVSGTTVDHEHTFLTNHKRQVVIVTAVLIAVVLGCPDGTPYTIRHFHRLRVEL